VGLNLLGILLARSLGRVEVHDRAAVVTAIATTVVVGTRGLLIKGLLVVVITTKDCLILLAELGGLLLQL
jgi:hypothetical protein